MRLLFITPELPNELHRIRALNLIRGLSRNHEIDLISLTHRPPVGDSVERLRAYCRQVDWVLQSRWRSLLQCALGLPSPKPLEACFEYSPELAALLRERVASGSYDLLYVKRLRMAQYAADAAGLPRVLDLTDAMARYYELAWRRARWPAKALFWEEWLKHRVYEPRLASRFDQCLVASAVDASYLRDREGVANVEVVPNAVDTDIFQPRPGLEEPATFVMSGLMDKLVNVDAVQYLCGDIWPQVRAALPQARLRLVGPNPSAAVRAFDGRDGVEVAGLVPDLRDEIARATAVLVPLRVGTGTKNKLLQSLAMARPAVTSSVGNEGLDAVSGKDVLVADTAEEFAAAIIRLQSDGALRASLGAHGRAWAVEHFSVPVMLRQLEETLKRVAGARSAASGRGAAVSPQWR